eukprot:CAMPEP_0182451438 /NCGR_PEP_ID=MMETSP1172-20130603/43721_1 /TAXON_ID=708627 /ORGANISM="Timspurckia oligopyrenoides, Strain CCMP3278" /LENGTH=641 /DNA_ID=CAMNT_0024649213 /DNA_START=42 /DNA_END=1967 /DNA_ORIENTATION=+
MGKSGNDGLGRALQNRANRGGSSTGRRDRRERASLHHTTLDNPTGGTFTSVLDVDDLTQLMLDAEFSQRDFAPDRYTQPVLLNTAFTTSGKPNEMPKSENNVNENVLRIPRRPKWDERTTPTQLEASERELFLTWRRSLAEVEEQLGFGSFGGSVLTPFEKNLEIWRQLWRVVERSDVVCQIVDARNPLLFLCSDLESYAYEFSPPKRCIVLVNKADFLPSKLVESWKTYFESIGIEAYFFSAAQSAEAREESSENEDTNDDADLDADDSERESSEDDKIREQKDIIAPEVNNTDLNKEFTKELPESDLVLDVDDLLELFRSFIPSEKKSRRQQLIRDEENEMKAKNPMETRCVVGLVGYPNVGKSSTINAILGSKRVAVSSTPGKTKHFQTFVLDDDLMLCDCPGLVFPNLSASRADLICNGIIPIDQLREPLEPIKIVVDQVPQRILDFVYGIQLQRSSTELMEDTFASAQEATTESLAMKLLAEHARARGFMTDHGKYDISRSARVILKDYVNGTRTWYCHGPPGVDGSPGCGKALAELESSEMLIEAAQNKGALLESSSNQVKTDIVAQRDFDADSLVDSTVFGASSLASSRTGMNGQTSKKSSTKGKVYSTGVVVKGRQQSASFNGARIQRPYAAK